MVTLIDAGEAQDAVGAPDLGDGEVVEVGLFLTARQWASFEAAAHRRGLTAGELLRRLLGGFLGQAEQRGADRPS